MERAAQGDPARLPAVELNTIITHLIKLSSEGRDVRKSPQWAALHPKDKKKVVRALSTGTLLPVPASSPRPSSTSSAGAASAGTAPLTPSALAGESVVATPASQGSTPVNLMAGIMRESQGPSLSLYQPPVSASPASQAPGSNSASRRSKRARSAASSTPASKKKPRRKRSRLPLATRYYLEDEVVTDSDESDGDDEAGKEDGAPAAEAAAAAPDGTAASPHTTDGSPAADSGLLSAAEAKRQQLAARRAKRAAAARDKGKGAVKRFIPRVVPDGAHFCSELRAMMFGFGDSCHPSLQVAAALEADAMRYATEMVRMLRVLSGGKPITLKHIMQHMGGAVAVYFRWKAMKKMAKGSRGGDEGGEGGGESPVDDEELEEWGDSAAVAAGLTPAGSGADSGAGGGGGGTPLAWDDTPPAPVDDGLARGMLLAGDEDDDEADLAAELEANAELELRQEAAGGGAQGEQGGAAAPPEGSAAQVTTTLSPWQVFKTRLRFANVRTRNMTTLQYREFARCREAYFAATPSLTKAFSSRLPKPALKRACLDVVAYCAFDRVACVVEAANRIVHNGVLSSPKGALPEPAYTAALTALPQRPPTLELAVRTQHAAATAAAKQAEAAAAIASAISPGATDRAAARKKRLAALNAAAALQKEHADDKQEQASAQ